MTRLNTALIVALLCLSATARANCEKDVQDITPKVQEIKDDKARQKAEDYLQRAIRELDENDEFECESAIGAINKLIEPPQPK